MTLRHVPDLDSLELLLEVAGAGSLGRAAAQHGLSQPAASARIQAMERLVGFPLLTRSARGSTLTANGALLADWAREVLSSAAVLAAGIASLRGEREGAPAEMVALNAGAALYVTRRAESLADGVRQARDGLRSGRAAATLDALILTSRQLGTQK